MMMSVVSMGIVTLTWVIFGFSWAFGDNGPVIGNFDFAFFTDLDMKMWGDSGLPGLVFASFQMTFAIIVSWMRIRCRSISKFWKAPYLHKTLHKGFSIEGALNRFGNSRNHDPGFGDYLGVLGRAHALQRLRRAPDPVVARLLQPLL